jgi:hypothetical protein
MRSKSSTERSNNHGVVDILFIAQTSTYAPGPGRNTLLWRTLQLFTTYFHTKLICWHKD